jgi:uncharacterized membrane protein
MDCAQTTQNVTVCHGGRTDCAQTAQNVTVCHKMSKCDSLSQNVTVCHKTGGILSQKLKKTHKFLSHNNKIDREFVTEEYDAAWNNGNISKYYSYLLD